MSDLQEQKPQQRKKLPFATVELPEWQSLNPQVSDTLFTMASELGDKFNGTRFFINKWLSENDLHKCGNPILLDLASKIEAAVNRVAQRPAGAAPLQISTMWGMISRQGMEGKPHDHKGRISVAYYVAAGESGKDAGGLFGFHEDRANPKPNHLIQPRDGLMVIFPSNLFHSVSQYSSGTPRIVISANLS